MKLSGWQRIVVMITCAVWQIVVLAGTAFVVGWRDWSPAWFAFAVFLLIGSSPSVVIEVLER